MGDDGELDGLVLEEQLWAVPAEQRPWIMLTQLMVPFNQLARADARRGPLSDVLPRLNPLRPVVTVWRDDRLLGVVPPKLLAERLKRRRAKPSATERFVWVGAERPHRRSNDRAAIRRP